MNSVITLYDIIRYYKYIIGYDTHIIKYCNCAQRVNTAILPHDLLITQDASSPACVVTTPGGPEGNDVSPCGDQTDPGQLTGQTRHVAVLAGIQDEAISPADREDSGRFSQAGGRSDG